MRDVAAEQLEPLNRTQRLFAGVLLLLLVDVIWVVSHKHISMVLLLMTFDFWESELNQSCSKKFLKKLLPCTGFIKLKVNQFESVLMK